MRRIRLITVILLVTLAGQGFSQDQDLGRKALSFGFRGIVWGVSASSVPGLHLVRGNEEDKDYTIENEKLKISEATLSRIEYQFRKDQFEEVLIRYKGNSNFTKLKQYLVGNYGPGKFVEPRIHHSFDMVTEKPATYLPRKETWTWWREERLPSKKEDSEGALGHTKATHLTLDYNQDSDEGHLDISVLFDSPYIPDP